METQKTNGAEEATIDPAIAAEIKRLVDRLVKHQGALGLSDEQFAARYRDWLNSGTSWMRLRQNKWQGTLTPSRWVKQLNELVDRLDGAASFEAAAFMDNLPFVRSMNAEYERLLGARLDRRGLFCLATEGCGKSWWASRKLEQANEGGAKIRCVYLRLFSTWREKYLQIASGLAAKIGATVEMTPTLQLNSLISQFRALGEVVVILDEAHYGGGALFSLLKDLTDHTSIRFVYMAFPTEYDKVCSQFSTGARAESRQLLRRAIKPIFDDYRHGIGPADVSAYLVGNGLKKSAELERIAIDLAPKLAQSGNLSVLADALDEARGQAAAQETELSLALIRGQVEALTSTYAERRAGK